MAARFEPLRRLRVLDLGNFLAGPIVGFHLAGLGADVIKVEKITGDDSRAVGPFAPCGESAYFMSVNRGKRSIALDARTDVGSDILRRLIVKSDIVIENFRPRVLERLVGSYSDLAVDNPALIMASISGFGQQGPHSPRPAFDSLIQAAGGLISVTGPGAESPPVRAGVSIVDMCSGLHATMGVLAALHHRTVTGLGQHVDTSMLATTANLMESPIARHSYSGGSIPRPEGLAHPAVSPFDGFKTRDGLLYIAASNDARAHVTLTALGLTDLISHCDFATNTSRMENRGRLKELMEEKLKAKTTAEWEAELIPAGVPCSAINDVAALKERHPEVFVEVEHRTAGAALLSGPPFEFSSATTNYAVPAPSLGEHTDEVLTGELGISASDVAKWRQGGHIY